MRKYIKQVAEWHPTKNGFLKPENVTPGSGHKVWWKCKKGHEWEALVRFHYNCPYCANRKVCLDNCLATLYPKIAIEWHPTKNGNVTPNDIIAGSHKKFWWTCTNGHEWEADSHHRTRGRNCPYCNGKKTSYDNCLQKLYPKIASEWHPIKNKNLTPYDVTAHSGKRVWWKCIKGHEWKVSINNRTCNKTNCPTCNESKGEKRITEILVQSNLRFKSQWRFSSCRNKLPLPFDFVIKTNNGIKIIEYQGEQHFFPIEKFGGEKEFKKLQKRDSIKRKWCKRMCVPLLEIPYWKYKNILNLLNEFIISS